MKPKIIVDCKSPKKKASTKQSEEKGSRKRKKSLWRV